MFSLYTTSYVLTCILYVLALYNIAYNIAYDIVYDIVCDVHSIGFGAGFRGFKLHALSRTRATPPPTGSHTPTDNVDLCKDILVHGPPL